MVARLAPWIMRPLAVLAAGSIALGLAGCGALGQGEQPGDLVIARMHWYRDAPGFLMHDLEWHHITGPDARTRLANLCGKDWPFGSRSCAFRVPQGGLCLVYSLFSQEEARRARDATGESIELHELRHCGVNLPVHGGWAHRETLVLR